MEVLNATFFLISRNIGGAIALPLPPLPSTLILQIILRAPIKKYAVKVFHPRVDIAKIWGFPSKSYIGNIAKSSGIARKKYAVKIFHTTEVILQKI